MYQENHSPVIESSAHYCEFNLWNSNCKSTQGINKELINNMKKLAYLIIFFLLTAPFSAYCAETELVKIHAAENNNNVQIYMTFQEVPTFRQIQKGKRVDVVLETLLSNSEPINYPVDDKVVKFLTLQKQEETILSFFLRYTPQKYKITRQDDTTLVLDILLGNQFTKTYPELSSKLQGLTIVTQQGDDFANPYISNPYAKNWRSFFSRYTPEIPTTAPLHFSVPPFPIIDFLPDITSSDILHDDLFSMAVEELWEDMIPFLQLQLQRQVEPETKKLLALTLGEILFRAGDFENSFKQLYLLNDKYGDEYVGIAASYLLAHLRAEHEDIHLADFAFRNLDQHIDDQFKLSPYIYLSQIESGLTTGQLERAYDLLQKDNIALPSRLALLKELRQSDYWFAAGDLVKAYVGYQLFDEKSILDSQPFSLNGYCNTLYSQKKFEEASKCFLKLSSAKLDKEELSLITIKKALAELHYKSAREMYVIFSSIEDAYPGTMAGFRAAMKKADVRYLSQPSWRKTSAKYYKAFAAKATNRGVAEEAALKEAIVHYELGNNAETIELLLKFLRDYRAGELTDTAKALLIEVLPGHLKQLLESKQYVKALVLAKKNRELFQKNWLDLTLLGLLAKAYHELSIFEEAKKLYLFLLSRSDEVAREHYYLPLLSILYSQGNYDLIEDYSTQYFYNYPNGQDQDLITLLRLKALIADNNEDLALEMLNGDLPETLQIDEIAANLYFKNKQYESTIQTLQKYWSDGLLTDENSLFILAESNFQSKRFIEAEELFKTLHENSKYFDHSRYRLAMIERNKGKEENSLKLFEEIVEKGKDPLWIKLAERELQFHELAKKH